jgi:hypothetical protein
MIRVLKPGGKMILFELIRGKGLHIFPRKPQDWIREVELCGATMIDCFGQEYLLPDRLFVGLAQTLTARRGNHPPRIEATSRNSSSMEHSVVHRLYWQMRRIIVTFSVWIEPLFVNIFPPSTATHAVFVFRKKL